MHANGYGAQVDCVAEKDLCTEHFVQAFPSIRVFRRGHDEVRLQGVRAGSGVPAGVLLKVILRHFAKEAVVMFGVNHKLI